MQFTFTGNNTLFLEQSFFDLDGALSIEITSITPTEVVVSHTVFTNANVTATFRGTGFEANDLGLFTAGQITSMEFDGLGIRQGAISDIDWSAPAIQSALFDVANSNDFTAIAALFNSAGPISVDATGGQAGFDLELGWEPLLPLLTTPITFTGSPFDDAFEGTSADDVINPGLNSGDGDRIAASEGSDTIVFDIPEGASVSGYTLDYDTIGGPVVFTINGNSNAGSVIGPDFVDLLENVNDALAFYLGLEGTAEGDTYAVSLTEGQVLALIGGPGADSYDIAGDGGIPILDFLFSDADSGLDMNLATGVISDDGFGFAETLDITGTPERLIVLGTDSNDRVTDGDGDQLVRLYDGDDIYFGGASGQDSVDGGAGNDLVRFDGIDQGQVTITFDAGISTLTDRTAPGQSTAVFAVEDLQTAGEVILELDKHDGIGLISGENLTTLTELYIAYYNRAPDALGLSFWATAFQTDGFSFEEIADLFFTQPETIALYSDVSDGDFVTEVYNNVFGRDPDQPGLEFWTEQLASGGTTESGFILDFLAGARAETGSPADVGYIENKTDIGLYFSAIQGQSNLAAANDVMDAFNGSADSVQDAQSLADAALAAAENGDTELLLPVIGVIESPFPEVA